MDSPLTTVNVAGGLFALLCIIWAVSQHVQSMLANPLNKIPGPLYARFTTIPLKLAVISQRRIHHIHALHEHYGPIVRCGPNELAISDVQAHRKIHGINPVFDKSDWYRSLSDFDRDGIIMMNGKAHAARRRLLSKQFGKSHLRQHWEEHVRECVVLAVSRIREGLELGCPVDVLKWWTFMASDVVAKLMFGESFHTLEEGVVSDYIQQMQLVLIGGGIGAEMPWVRWVGKKIPFGIFRQLWGRGDNDWGVEYGKRAVRELRLGKPKANMCASMMAETDKDSGLDDLDVACEARNFVIAGTDTTSVTLAYLVWAVLSKPNLQEKLEEEVQGLPENFKEADLERLELLNAIVDETLRLYGGAPGGLPRIVPVGGMELGGFHVPGGTTVTTQAYSYHRDPVAYPEPYEFIPERWMSSHASHAYHLEDPSKTVFTPFGTGPKNCLGQNLAVMEIRLATAEFFRRCPGARLALSTTPESMEIRNVIFITPRGHKC